MDLSRYDISTGNPNYDARQYYNQHDHYNPCGGQGGNFRSGHNRDFCSNQFNHRYGNQHFRPHWGTGGCQEPSHTIPIAPQNNILIVS